MAQLWQQEAVGATAKRVVWGAMARLKAFETDAELGMNAIEKLKSVEPSVSNDVESSGVLGDNVESSGVRGKRGRSPKHVIVAENHEETALARLLFGWGTAATVVGMTAGGLLFDPVGALLGSVLGSAVGVVTVVIVVLVRGTALESPPASDEEDKEISLD